MSDNRNVRGFLLMVLVMFSLLGIRHFTLLQAPNQYFIGDSLDGFRSLAAAFFHIRHDAASDHYQGMNYPYGDRPGYTDNIPILTNAVKYFAHNKTDYFLAIWNLSLIFSQLVSALLMYLIFRQLKLPVWYAIAAAAGLSTLTPQIDRFAAHYALSFGFFIPLTILLLLRFDQKPAIWLSVLLGLIPILGAEIHPYHMAMVVFLIAGYFFFRFLYQPGRENLRRTLLHASIQVLLPLIFLYYITVITDPVTDRPAWPWGFLAFTTRLQSLILPIDLPLGSFIQNNLTDISYVPTESRAYLGLVAILGGLLLLGGWVKNGLVNVGRNKIAAATTNSKFRIFSAQPALKYLGWASFIILIYAAGIPFVFPGCDWWADYLGPLRQFRGLGRFAWVFFYVANVMVLYGLYQWVNTIAASKIRTRWFALILGVLLFEGVGYLFWESYELMPRPDQRELYSRAGNPWMDSLDIDRYQAILPLPYYHIGSENFWINPLGKQLHRTVWAGAEMGLPCMGSFMGRTSVGQTIKLIEAVSEPYRRPAFLDDLPDRRPLLVFISKDAWSLLAYRYQHLVQGHKKMYEDDNTILYELPIEAFEQRWKTQLNDFRREVEEAVKFSHGEISSNDSIVNFVYRSYNDQAAAYFYKNGALALPGRETHLLYEGPIPQQQPQVYVISVWIKMDEDLSARTGMDWVEYVPGSNEVVYSQHLSLSQSIRSVDRGWMLVDVPVEMKRADSAVRLTIANNDLLYGKNIFLDELQIRPQATRLYHQEKNWLVVNNRWVPKE